MLKPPRIGTACDDGLQFLDDAKAKAFVQGFGPDVGFEHGKDNPSSGMRALLNDLLCHLGANAPSLVLRCDAQRMYLNNVRLVHKHDEPNMTSRLG